MVEKRGDWEALKQRLQILVVNSKGFPKIIQGDARMIQGEMMAQAPVDTGFMRDNIVVRDLPDGAEIESKAGYSGWVNYGTSRQAPQSFFTSPILERWPKLKKVLEKMFFLPRRRPYV